MIVIGVILGALLLMLLETKLYARYWDKDLTVTLEFARESVVQGESCVLCECVENRKLLPLPALKVKFQVSRQLQFEETDQGSSVTDQYYRNDVLSIRPYMRHVRKLSFICKKRGFYLINGLDLVAGDLFLSSELPKSLSSDARLYVYPKPYCGLEFVQALTKLNGEILSRRHLLEDPFEYRGIREYSVRDTMRDINWKAAARTGELKVNMKNYTAEKAVRLFLNLEDGTVMRQEKLLEISISMAAGAARDFLSQGMRTALYTNGPDILTREMIRLEAAGGAGHMESINRGLARIDLDKKAPPFVELLQAEVLKKNESGQELFSLFFSADMRDDFQELLCACIEKRMDFAWFCPVSGQAAPKVRPKLEPYFIPVPV